MPEPADAPTRSRGSLIGVLLVAIAAASVLLYLQTATEGLYGYDGYFHIRYAQVLRSQGFSRSFPWWQETFLRDHFADKDFLYHVLLIPFTLGDLVLGGKVAAVLFGSAVIAIFGLACRKLRVPWSAGWALGLLGCSAAFLYRLDFTRPLVLAVGLTLAGTCAILLGDARWTFAFAAIYPNAHISFHLLPCIALLHDWIRGKGEDGRRSFRLAKWAAAGAIAGALLSPYVPNNLRLWWVQNIRVLEMAWTGPTDLRLGLEIQPGTSADLLMYNAAVLAVLLGGILLMVTGRKRSSPEAVTLLIVSAGFLALTMMSRRFLEFWTPLTCLFAAVAWRDRIETGECDAARLVRGGASSLPGGAAGRRAAYRFLPAAALVSVTALLAFNTVKASRLIAGDPGLTYQGASEWMGANVPPGETIFHLDWDDFPQLFFFNPQLHYLVGLDPTFMYLTSPERWRIWSDVAHADVDDIYTPIRRTFGSRWVFAIPEGEDFLAMARRDPRFFQRYEDSAATVFFLADGYTFVTGWRLMGWYPDSARRLFDVPLDGEPGDDAVPAAGRPGAEGPSAAGLNRSFPSGFVDLEKGLKLPAGVQDACGVARAVVRSAEPAEATLALTSDDEFRAYVNGAQVLSNSPFAVPPPGAPGGEPVSIDQYLEFRSHVPERSATVALIRGENTVVVKTCRAGQDFGFFLRIYLRDGGSLPAAEVTDP